ESIMGNFDNVEEEKSDVKVLSADGKVNVDAAKSLTFPSEPFVYTERDVILYNLGIGATRKELDLVYENSQNFGAVPTFGVIPSFASMNAIPFNEILPNFN